MLLSSFTFNYLIFNYLTYILFILFISFYVYLFIMISLHFRVSYLYFSYALEYYHFFRETGLFRTHSQFPSKIFVYFIGLHTKLKLKYSKCQNVKLCSVFLKSFPELGQEDQTAEYLITLVPGVPYKRSVN